MSHYNPENVHNGTAQGIVNLENGVAVYEVDGCRLKMEFFSTKIRITQAEGAGDCGFGANVTATGSYRKVDGKKPKFDFDESGAEFHSTGITGAGRLFLRVAPTGIARYSMRQLDGW